MLTIGSLFSGIGGLELGLEMAGLGPTLWQVERERFCQAVLEKHWPKARRFDDVCAVGAAQLPQVDLICGGFPCQDVSSSGPRVGLAGSRSGLWREFARVVGELCPPWVVVENVTSGAGLWFDAVVRELEALGYDCLPVPISARDVGAPHLRERLFVVAHAHAATDDLQHEARRGLPGASDAARIAPGSVARSPRATASDHASDVDRQPSESGRRQGERTPEEHAISGRDSALPRVCPRCCAILIEQGLAEPGHLCEVCSDPLFATDAHNQGREGPGPREQAQGREGLAPHAGWSSEPGVVPLVHGLSGGLAGRRRRARIRALGNSVVPQCAEVVGWVIRELLESERTTSAQAAL